uniref:Fructokinase-like protein n=1 Tax=Tanacetum cinerariifolium TaxID=118510 RepID=A0A6L2LR22_TANCI|nr:fructokinase-like protein [Tanacetum cinerariifolium]
MVSFGRKSDFRVSEGDFQDIRGIRYNDDFVIPSQGVLSMAKVFHYETISLIPKPCRSAHLKAMEVVKKAGALLSYDPNMRLPLCSEELWNKSPGGGPNWDSWLNGVMLILMALLNPET